MKNLDIAKKIVNSIFNSNNYFFHEFDSSLTIDMTFYSHCVNGDILIFSKEQDYQRGDCELYSINKAKKTMLDCFFFCHRVDTPAVMYHKDGSGTPADSDMTESKNSFPTFKEAVVDFVKFLVQIQLDEVFELIEEHEIDEITSF